MSESPLLRLAGIVREYTLRDRSGAFGRRHRLRAVDGVDLDVNAGEIVSLVGESGSGKSTLARVALLLERPDEGTVEFAGRDLTTLSERELRAARRDFQIVFQDPLSSLNPRWRIDRSIARPLHVHGLSGWATPEAAVRELLELVELPAELGRRYPHELSGGQRQRACIARALVLRPKLIVADEAVSALDVSTQASILELLRTVRDEYGSALLFIAHDLRIVRHFSARVAVMQQGRVVEFRTAKDLFADPQHPYSRMLIDSVVRPRFRSPLEVLNHG